MNLQLKFLSIRVKYDSKYVQPLLSYEHGNRCLYSRAHDNNVIAHSIKFVENRVPKHPPSSPLRRCREWSMKHIQKRSSLDDTPFLCHLDWNVLDVLHVPSSASSLVRIFLRVAAIAKKPRNTMDALSRTIALKLWNAIFKLKDPLY